MRQLCGTQLQRAHGPGRNCCGLIAPWDKLSNYVVLMQRGMVMWSVVASSGIVLPSCGHEKILLGSMGAAHWE